ncbi:hypothetical protein YPPY25_4719, partial [Yersinia pestis PY-25]
MAGGGA